MKRKKTGGQKKHNENKDRKGDHTHDDEIVAEAESKLKAMRTEVLPVETLDPTASISGTGLSDNVTRAAVAAGLTKNKIVAATVLASGNSIKMAAAEAGVAATTVRSWKKQLPFRAFLNELTIGLVDEAKGESIRHLFQQLRNDPDKIMSEKDIYDWVKLGLQVGGQAGGGGRMGGAPSASILHQHVHLHGEDAGNHRDADDALLVNLKNATSDIEGAKRRQISKILQQTE